MLERRPKEALQTSGLVLNLSEQALIVAVGVVALAVEGMAVVVLGMPVRDFGPDLLVQQRVRAPVRQELTMQMVVVGPGRRQ